jgi:hypothetical protein
MHNITHFLDNIIDNYAIRVFVVLFFFLHLIHVLVIFNITVLSSGVLHSLDTIAQIFICFVLFYRFNPWRNVKVNENDKHVIFGAALFLFSNLAITQYYVSYFNDFYYDNADNKTVNKK